MNAPIARLFGVVVVLFSLLIIWTTRWTVIDSKKLDSNQLNRLTLINDLRIKRGRILAADGTVLARSIPADQGTWTRAYPLNTLFGQPVGYLRAAQGQSAGLERSRGAELRGLQTGLSSVFGQLGGSQRVGDDVYTSLDPKAQLVARQQLAGQVGSVVALDPSTGAVRVMYSNPSYDDNNPFAPCSMECQVNRATQGRYPPGSTFKVVTATAAIDSGRYSPSSVVDGKSPITVSGVPLQNDGNKSYGPIDLTTALTDSVNTVWAQVAQNVGRATMTNYMERFGFYSKPPLDYPPDELFASRPYSFVTGRPYSPGSPDEDIGRIGIGEGGMEVTPLQMAMVAAAVANGGKLMVPHLADRVVDQTGRVVETIKPAVQRQVMTPTTAAEVEQMMRKVVEEGTGAPASLPGVSVAGKTGTAQINIPLNITQPWFIGIAPVQSPSVVVAVTVERSNGGFGGTVAAPIAAAVIRTLLADGSHA